MHLSHNPSAALSIPQITVLDTGGQYTHLIARRVRELGVYADVQPSDVPASELRDRKGIIISGGPASVYERGSPDVDPRIFSQQIPILGICYGHQLLAHHLGGSVEQGHRGEYGMAHVSVIAADSLWKDVTASQVWMSHRDTVQTAPPGFRVTAASGLSGIAAMSDRDRKLFGIQFHPEVVHTHAGRQILTNFVFDICGAHTDWDVTQRVPLVEEQIRQTAADRNVFFFVSGGVDSTVAFTLCLRALGPERVFGTYVDTGLMREAETDFVRGIFAELGARHFLVEHAEAEFLEVLHGLHEPEAKRLAIGEQFVKVQERILATEHFLDGQWILGQGTIYPDTIESGGTAKADLIKTHHNRVAGIQALIQSGSIIEPLTSFYKDEVREIGREIGVPGAFLQRHPFPGPGLAIRCLCSAVEAVVVEDQDGFILPVKSVGVQGDSRSYRNVLALGRTALLRDLAARASDLISRRTDINRVVALCESEAPLGALKLHVSTICETRLDLLRRADGLVRRWSAQHNFEEQVWQFPVILIPVGTAQHRESVVLRPVQSVDGMTADAIFLESEALEELTAELLGLDEIAAVFYDLTSKPPGTIEWE